MLFISTSWMHNQMPKQIIYAWLPKALETSAIFDLRSCGDMDVSENSGTPKSSILIGFSIINHPFWGTPIYGNTHMYTVQKCHGGRLSCSSQSRNVHLPPLILVLTSRPKELPGTSRILRNRHWQYGAKRYEQGGHETHQSKIYLN